MDTLHNVLRSISRETKSRPDHLSVFREFLSHLDRAALWSRITDAPFLTLNEKRAVVGYGPLEGGDRLE